MIRCPICRERFSEQCEHLLFFKSWQNRLEGTPVLTSAVTRIEVAMLHGIQNGHGESPVPELAGPYATLRNALAQGVNESNAMYYAGQELVRAFVDYVRYLDPAAAETVCDPSLEIWVPEGKARLASSSHVLHQGMRSAVFRMSRLYWSENPKVVYELLDYRVSCWCGKFDQAPACPDLLDRYFPVNADTELSFDANRFNGCDGLIPFDSSPETTVRSLRIALRAAAAGSGPFLKPDSQFLYHVGSRSRIRLETAVRIIAMETPEILHAALPALRATAREAERLIPQIRRMAMADPCRVFYRNLYDKVITFTGYVERYSQQRPDCQCPVMVEQGGQGSMT